MSKGASPGLLGATLSGSAPCESELEAESELVASHPGAPEVGSETWGEQRVREPQVRPPQPEV